VSRFKRYWVWIDGKTGVPPHRLQEEIAAADIRGLTWGHSFQTWESALSYLRECMRAGFVVRVYEESE
jgi:hypothetical protein